MNEYIIFYDVLEDGFLSCSSKSVSIKANNRKEAVILFNNFCKDNKLYYTNKAIINKKYIVTFD